MEKLMAAYLFNNGHCPLPGIGSLQIHAGSAKAFYANKSILGPQPEIRLVNKEENATPFLHYLIRKLELNEQVVITMVGDFCAKINHTGHGEELSLANAGYFIRTKEGKLKFHSAEVPVSFFPEMPLERIIKPGNIHQVRVGDTETTSDVMTEYLNEAPQVKKFTWWMAVMLLLLIGIGLIIFYQQATSHQELWGNSRPILPQQPSSSYQIVN
jgi:hypothetical protein